MIITLILAQSPNEESSFNWTTFTIIATTSCTFVVILFIMITLLIRRFQTNKQTSRPGGPGK